MLKTKTKITKKSTIKKTAEPIKSAKVSSDRFHWRNFEYLNRFMTERAKVLPRKRTGLSPKNQRQLARAIKHARYLGLLPYQAEI